VSEPPAALLALQGTLGRRLRERGFVLEERAFTPHLTLARKTCRSMPLAATAVIAWRVDAFTLVRTEPGSGRYVIEDCWGLGT
jgi:2'-5' RNA ligase